MSPKRKKRNASDVAIYYYGNHKIPRIGASKAKQIASKDISKECEKDDGIYDRNYLAYELDILIFTNPKNQSQIEPLNVGEIITHKSKKITSKKIDLIEAEEVHEYQWWNEHFKPIGLVEYVRFRNEQSLNHETPKDKP